MYTMTFITVAVQRHTQSVMITQAVNIVVGFIYCLAFIYVTRLILNLCKTTSSQKRSSPYSPEPSDSDFIPSIEPLLSRPRPVYRGLRATICWPCEDIFIAPGKLGKVTVKHYIKLHPSHHLQIKTSLRPRLGLLLLSPTISKEYPFISLYFLNASKYVRFINKEEPIIELFIVPHLNSPSPSR
jgi:hypothetical protein